VECIVRLLSTELSNPALLLSGVTSYALQLREDIRRSNMIGSRSSRGLKENFI
jgi:hypothetical protein